MSTTTDVATPVIPVTPSGWRILIQPKEIKRESTGGIVLADETVKAQEYLRYVGKVVAMGPLCYQGEKFTKKSETGPDTNVCFCDVGDWVVYGKYAGQEVIGKHEGASVRFKLLNDDEILAVVADPDFIEIPV